jgi:hypothetical protein
MKLNLLTRDTVKEELGLTDATYDTQIDSLIPRVSNDVRRILNYGFDDYFTASFDSGSNEIQISANRSFGYSSTIASRLPFNMGQVVYHPNIPDDTYIISYDPDTSKYSLSANATDDGDYVYPTLQISQWSAVSKMIWYRISVTNTDDAEEIRLKSLKVGTYSETYADSEINQKYNYPQKLIDDLGPKYLTV